MDDDFNCPEVLPIMFELVKEINRVKAEQPEVAAKLAATLRLIGSVLGVAQLDPAQFLQGTQGSEQDEVEQIEALIAARAQARLDKDWALADECRDKLDALNVILEDGANGTTWRKK